MVPISTFIESKMSTPAYSQNPSGHTRPPPALRDPAQEPWTQLHTDIKRERSRTPGIRPAHKKDRPLCRIIIVYGLKPDDKRLYD